MPARLEWKQMENQWRKHQMVLSSQNKSFDELEWRCWPGLPQEQPFNLNSTDL